MGTNHISGTAEANVVEFCTLVGDVKSQNKDNKSPLKVAHFNFLGHSYISGKADARVVTSFTHR